MNWDELSKDEKNRLIHEKVLQLPIPGKVAELFLQDLVSRGVPIEHQGTRKAYEEYNPTKYLPNYIGEINKAYKVFHSIYSNESLKDDFILALIGHHKFEIREIKDANELPTQNPDKICHMAALVLGLVDE